MNVRVDNRYVYKYLEEQHQRDARTLGVHRKQKKEVPFILGICRNSFNNFIYRSCFISSEQLQKILDHSVIGDGFNEGYYGMSSGTDKSWEQTASLI